MAQRGREKNEKLAQEVKERDVKEREEEKKAAVTNPASHQHPHPAHPHSVQRSNSARELLTGRTAGLKSTGYRYIEEFLIAFC